MPHPDNARLTQTLADFDAANREDPNTDRWRESPQGMALRPAYERGAGPVRARCFGDSATGRPVSAHPPLGEPPQRLPGGPRRLQKVAQPAGAVSRPGGGRDHGPKRLRPGKHRAGPESVDQAQPQTRPGSTDAGRCHLPGISPALPGWLRAETRRSQTDRHYPEDLAQDVTARP